MKVALMLLISFLYANIYCQIDNDSIIYWEKNILKWTDFKGEIPDSIGYQVALSFIEFKTNAHWEQGMPEYQIFAVFNKYKSWSTDTSVAILEHEQLHFDISELYARKIRKAMFELREKADTCVNDYMRALTILVKECNETNEKYDTETAHGIYKKKQKEWDKKIAKRLYELKHYKVNYSKYSTK